ncbi:MAG: AI-2E family transporter [Endomicrobium sp.]|jgi:predicted PurR-regulated permease PerM|nr:AI-2E family transporter [Endomicrobium sp.]
MTESTKNRVFIILVILFLGCCLFLYLARSVLAPFLIAAFITYLISPLVTKIQSFGYKRFVGVALVAVVLVSIFAGVLTILIPILINELESFQVNADKYYEYFLNYLDSIREKIELIFPILKRYNVSNEVIFESKDFLLYTAQQIPNYLTSIFSIFSIIILIPMLVFFMLLSGNKYLKSLVTLLPSNYVETILSIVYQIDAIFGRYIRGQIIEAFFVGSMSALSLGLLGVNFALLIGIIAGIANLIPYLGPIVGLTLAVAVGAVQYQTFSIVIKIVIVYAIIKFLDDNFIQPLIVGHNVNLGPVSMVFAMLAGGHVFGFLGVVFAVPVAAILKSVFVMLVKRSQT